MKFNWKTLVKTVAPALGTALGGPVGGFAAKAIAGLLLPNKPGATEDEIAEAVMSATPEQLIQLKQLDQQFARDMKALDIDVFRLETVDVQSARELYRVNYWPQVLLSVVFVGGYFTIMGLLLTGKVTVPDSLKDVVTVLIGIMSASVTAIMGFWFGSSFGSREKTAALAASAPVQ